MLFRSVLPIQRLPVEQALPQELGRRIAQQRPDRQRSKSQLAEQAGASATQLSLLVRRLREQELMEPLNAQPPALSPGPVEDPEGRPAKGVQVSTLVFVAWPILDWLQIPAALMPGHIWFLPTVLRPVTTVAGPPELF